MTLKNYDALFEQDADDYRTYLTTSDGKNGKISMKWVNTNSTNQSVIIQYKLIPIIRLSEMYYIAAECEPKVSDGNSWLNQIRTLRGLPEITITDENELMSKLRIEYLREFW